MLEETDHQHPFVTGQNVFRAVAVVDVEVNDCNALQVAPVQGM